MMGITSPLSPTFFWYILLFVFSQFSIFLIGGWVVEKYKHIEYLVKNGWRAKKPNLECSFELQEPLEHLIFYYVLGLTTLTATGILFSWWNVRWLSFLLIIEGLIWAVKSRSFIAQLLKNSWLEVVKLSLRIKALLAVGIIAQISATLPTGWLTDQGINFYRLNSEDGILHVAFSETMKRSFPPLQPGADGLPITNYHYWSDFFIGEVSRLFQLPTIHLYFHFIPVILAIFLGLSIILLAKQFSGKEPTQFWVLFTHFFAGNATFIFTQLVHGEWRWNTPAIDHGVLQFFNMPQAFARLIIVMAIICLVWFMKKKDFGPGLAAVFLFAVSTGFKVYFGMFAALAVSMLVMFETIKLLKSNKLFNSWHKKLITLLLIQAIISALVFFPVNKNAGGLIFDPLFWPKLMLGQSNIEWNEWWLRMQVYEAAGNTRNILIFRFIAISIFGLSVFGTRLLGLLILPSIKNKLYIKYIYWSILLSSVIFMLIGMNFIQVSGGANVFNFFVVALLFLGLFAGFHLGGLEEKFKNSKSILVRSLIGIFLLIFVVLSVPRPLQDAVLFLRSWSEGEEGVLIPQHELIALEFLRTSGDAGTIQSSPENTHDYLKGPYVAYFSGNNSYYAAEIILQSHNQPVADRPTLVEDIFDGNDNQEVVSLLDQANIKYLYMRINEDEVPSGWLGGPPTGLETYYQSDEVLILKRI